MIFGDIMALFGRKKSKTDYNEIKDMINQNVASSIRTQPSFSELLRFNGCSTLKVGAIGSKIRKQLLNEAKNGDLTVETVMPRAYELIGEFLGISDVKTFEDMAIENNAPRIQNNKPLYCGNCGSMIQEGSKFCPDCGNKLIIGSIECSKCGEINEYGSNFCVNCGNNLKETNDLTREEFEEKVEKIKEHNNSLKLNISVNGKETENSTIEKDNPNLGKRNVKFKSMEYGIDISKQLNQKLDDMVIENYGTDEEKARLNARKDKEKVERQKYQIIHDKYEKADKLMLAHNYNDAIPLFREVIEDSEVYDSTVSLSYTFLSDCYVCLHEYDNAVSVIYEQIEVMKEFNENYNDLESQIEKIKKYERQYKSKGLRERGLKLFYSGNYDEAIPFFKECIGLSDDDSKTYNRLVDIYIAKRDFESANEVLEKGIENVTWEYALQNEHKNGLKDRLENINSYLETGILKGEKMPYESESIKSEIKNAKRILKEEDKEKGIQLLENIIKKGTYTNTAYYTLYQTYMKDKKYDDAIRISDLAIESLGLFDQDRLEKWTKYKDKAIAKKGK